MRDDEPAILAIVHVLLIICISAMFILLSIKLESIFS